jgi:AcrR family transcriptional regulator
MSGRREERQIQRRREALERAMGLPGTGEESLYFHDHADLVRGLGETLERAGLPEAFQALARHLEEDRDHWLRRLERIEADPVLRARRTELDQDYLDLFTAHFGRWGAAGPQGDRTAALEACLLLAALWGAERLWVQGHGRPVLPVLVQEALALLWPALYGHARRHQPR